MSLQDLQDQGKGAFKAWWDRQNKGRLFKMVGIAIAVAAVILWLKR